MRNQALPAQHRIDQLLPVQPVHQRLAHRHLFEERRVGVLLVEIDQRIARDRRGEQLQVLVLRRSALMSSGQIQLIASISPRS